jgi:hypothetical protein
MVCYYLFIACCLLVSCQQSTKVKIQNDIVKKLQVSQSFDIKIDGEQYQHLAYQLKTENGDEILFGLDHVNQKIDLINLSQGRYEHGIDFSDAKNNFNEISQFFVHTADSIFLFSADLQTFWLINSRGENLNQWQPPYNLEDEEIASKYNFINIYAIGQFNTRFFYDGKTKQLIFPVLYMTDGYNILHNFAYKNPPIGFLNLQDPTNTMHLRGKFPINYQEVEVPFDPASDFIKVAGDIYQNFSFSDAIYSVTDSTFFTVASTFKKEEFTKFQRGKDPSTKKQMQVYHFELMYEQLIPIPDKRRLARVVKLAQEKNSGDKSNVHLQAPWTMIIYDLDKKMILCEYLFPANKYDFHHIFFKKEGFYILKENPYDLANDEEVFSLDYFKL